MGATVLTSDERAALVRYDRIVDSLIAHARTNGYQLAFVFIPRTYEPDTRRVDPVTSAIQAHLDSAGIPFNGLDSLWESPRHTIHFAHDGHYTAHGHRLVAQQLAKWLSSCFPEMGPPSL